MFDNAVLYLSLEAIMHRTPFRILIIGALILTVPSLIRLPAEAAHIAATPPALAQVGTFTNGTAISLVNNTPTSPYPSTISVSGLPGSITDVDVTLFTVNHSRPDDLDVLLVGPGGQSVIVMSDSCGNVNPNGVSYTFSDQAASPLEDTDPGVNCTTTGTYQPHNYPGNAPEPDTFAGPAPAGPYGAALSDFNGTNANGTWSLYVVDDIPTGFQGAINGGWGLTITTAGSKSAAGGSTAYVPTAADHARAQAPLCSLIGGGTNSIVRADVPSGAVTDGSVFCRVIAQNGVYVNGNNPSEIGNQDVLNQGVLQAVDVFGLLHSGWSWSDFNSPVKICLQGSGTFLYLDALVAPRTVSTLPAALEGGYTCAFIPDAGTAVLVQEDPPAAQSASSGGSGGPLNGCMVTTDNNLNLRAGPGRDSDVIRVVPYNVTLTATQRQGDWFSVDYLGTSGWLNAGYLTPHGACG
jgi:uncharacterized protein YgiM (DUF1202 family)/subtilisin-like proprotein convertase family protein